MLLRDCFPGGASVKESACKCRRFERCKRLGFDPYVRKVPSRRKRLQYSCLGNSMNRGAWWATVHGIANESNTAEQQAWHPTQ